MQSLSASSIEEDDFDTTTNREDFDRNINGEDIDTRERGMDEMEKPFCRGSQCRKNYSQHSQHMQVYAEMKKGQKNKGLRSLNWTILVLFWVFFVQWSMFPLLQFSVSIGTFLTNYDVTNRKL